MLISVAACDADYGPILREPLRAFIQRQADYVCVEVFDARDRPVLTDCVAVEQLGIERMPE